MMSDEWGTPSSLFRELEWRYGPFNLDAAAAKWNAKAPKYFTLKQNALAKRWTGRVWLNPPYSKGNLIQWMPKARAQVAMGHAELVCCLVPAYTCERWWHEAVEKPVGTFIEARQVVDLLGSRTVVHWSEMTITTIRLRGRQRFVTNSNMKTTSARFSSAVVVFQSPQLVRTSGLSEFPDGMQRAGVRDVQARKALASGATD